MYCNACGKAMAEDDRVCSRCGNMVGIPPAPKKLMRSRAESKIAGVRAEFAKTAGITAESLKVEVFEAAVVELSASLIAQTSRS